MKNRILLIDHDDSFTQILGHFLGGAKVVNHDSITLEEILNFDPSHIVLSPGPGSVENPQDFAIGFEILSHLAGKIPILGVCLGHQGIGKFYGAKLGRAPKVMHGKTSPISHKGTGIFEGLPSPMNVMRYHSLHVFDPPDCLEITATSDDGVIMGLQHKTLPIFGVQFHPESVESEYGLALLKNFYTEKTPRSVVK